MFTKLRLNYKFSKVSDETDLNDLVEELSLLSKTELKEKSIIVFYSSLKFVLEKLNGNSMELKSKIYNIFCYVSYYELKNNLFLLVVDIIYYFQWL